MIFINIDGALDDLRDLVGLPDLELQRGAHDLGGGRFRAKGVAYQQSVVGAIRAKGLSVTITLDEAEAKRRVLADHEMMHSALPESRMLAVRGLPRSEPEASPRGVPGDEPKGSPKQ